MQFAQSRQVISTRVSVLMLLERIQQQSKCGNIRPVVQKTHELEIMLIILVLGLVA